MIRVSALYPSGEGKEFDVKYYVKKHMPMVQKLLGELGLVRTEVDEGVSGGGPGEPPLFACIGHLYFNSVADFHKAWGTHGEEIVGDIPNYTDIPPQIQISEIVG